MQSHRLHLSVLNIALLMVICGAGCTRESRKNRYLERANGYFQAEQYQKAEIEYLNVLRLDPQNPVAIVKLASVCFEQGRAGAAFSLLRKAEQLQPDNLEVRLKLGLTSLTLAGLKEAREEAVYILDKQPTNEEALLLLAESSLKSTDLDDLQQRLQKLAPQIENRA